MIILWTRGRSDSEATASPCACARVVGVTAISSNVDVWGMVDGGGMVMTLGPVGDNRVCVYLYDGGEKPAPVGWVGLGIPSLPPQGLGGLLHFLYLPPCPSSSSLSFVSYPILYFLFLPRSSQDHWIFIFDFIHLSPPFAIRVVRLCFLQDLKYGWSSNIKEALHILGY